MGEILGYCRISSVSQNEARQIESLEKYGVDKLFIDKASARDTNREKLQELLNYARGGDTIVCHSLDRLVRSVRDLVTLVERFEQDGIVLVSIKDNLTLDNSNPYTKFQIHMLSAISELERSVIRERQREGIKIAQEKGVYSKERSKKYKLEEIEVYYDAYMQRESTKASIIRELGVSRPTLDRYFRRIEEQREEQRGVSV